jgi:hypothetical protein
MVVEQASLPEQLQLTTGTKKLVREISREIVESWPPFSGGLEPDSKNTLVLVNGYAFVTNLFNSRLQLVVNKEIGRNNTVSECWAH